MSGDTSIGHDFGANSNVVLVTDLGSLWTNSGDVNIGNHSSFNQLIITNSGRAINSGDVKIGGDGSFNSLVIANTGMVMNSMSFIGYNAGASNNSALVSGTNSVWNNTNGFAVGYGGAFNSLVITNGGALLNSTTGGVGIIPGANYNTALISGSGSVWSNGSGFAMGLYGVGNRLTINNGGLLVTSDGVMGENSGANSNVVVVTDSGSVWSNRGDLSIGVATVGNQLVITNGGIVRTLGNFRIGTNASLLNSATLYVGGDFANMATNQAINNFSGTNIFNGALVLQNLEVASAFATAGLGTATNFYFGTVSISNAWVRLVDNRVNLAGGGLETFGASNVIVALSQSILDLNNRTSFIQNLSNSGTILQTNAGPPGLVTRLDVVNTFTNAGTVLVGNGSVLKFSNAFINAWVVQLLAGGVLANFKTGGELTNKANASIFGDGLIAALIRNDGTITATGGTLRLSAGFDDGTLGNPVNAGVLQALGGSANLQVEQSFINTGTIMASNAAAFTTTASAPLRNDNLITIASQSTATFGAVVTNTGTITVQNQSLLQFNAGLTNNGTLKIAARPNPSTAIITGTLLLGSSGVISTGNTTNNTLVMRGDFVNGSTDTNNFNMRNGLMIFGGSTPLNAPGAWTNTFEVASTNKGAILGGFDNNMAVGTLNITNNIAFVNNINNLGGVGLSGTNEALYVDVLHLFSGATIKLSQLTVYVGMSFVDDASGQTFTGDTINEGNVNNYHGYDLSGHIFLDSGGRIVFVPEPSAAALLLAGAGVAWRFRRRSRDRRDNAAL
ncbi:MAG: PEP-CTERM sorting domain-containing protein [Verrucomicrobia bacterium]|nr:PEP-CTERM sorting domain-containing protein [Verrucomicrobiota bacterium]